MIPRRDSRGFTLLEITITLAIFGVVMSIVFGVFSQTIAGKEHAEARAEELASARAVLSRIANDLTNVRIAPAPRPVSAAAPQPTPTPSGALIRPEQGLFLSRVRTDRGVAIDDLAVSASLRRPTALTYAATDLGIVRYFVDTSADDPSQHGLYRETVFSLAGEMFDPDKPNEGGTMLLLPGVVGFDLRFFDGKEWVDGWDSTDSRNFGPAPFAVQMSLTVIDARGGSETYQTAIDLPTIRTVRNPQTVAPTPGAR